MVATPSSHVGARRARKIAKSYELGFAALWYYADGQRAQKDRRLSLLLAKKDGRLG